MTVMDEMDRLMELADKITDSREEVEPLRDKGLFEVTIITKTDSGLVSKTYKRITLMDVNLLPEIQSDSVVESMSITKMKGQHSTPNLIVHNQDKPRTKGKWQRIIETLNAGESIVIDENEDHDPDKNVLRAIRQAAESLGMSVESKRLIGNRRVIKRTR